MKCARTWESFMVRVIPIYSKPRKVIVCKCVTQLINETIFSWWWLEIPYRPWGLVEWLSSQRPTASPVKLTSFGSSQCLIWLYHKKKKKGWNLLKGHCRLQRTKSVTLSSLLWPLPFWCVGLNIDNKARVFFSSMIIFK